MNTGENNAIEIIEKVRQQGYDEGYKKGKDDAVVNARWKELYAHRDSDGYIVRDYECSACLGIIMDVYDSDEKDLPRYCCMCGARMDGDE